MSDFDVVRRDSRMWGDAPAALARIEAENARLREALERIACDAIPWSDAMKRVGHRSATDYREFARAALEGEEP